VSAISSNESYAGAPPIRDTVPRSIVVSSRVGSLTWGVTSTMTARWQSSGRVAASRMVVAPPSDIPTTARTLPATSPRIPATASAFIHGP